VESGGPIRWVRMRLASSLRYPVRSAWFADLESRARPSTCRATYLTPVAGLFFASKILLKIVSVFSFPVFDILETPVMFE